ncbi:MAG: hypothetical protein AAFS10_08570, partial [Myxococcota bacterium]
KTAVADRIIDNSQTRDHTFTQLHALIQDLPTALWPNHTQRAQAWIQTRLDRQRAVQQEETS